MRRRPDVRPRALRALALAAVVAVVLAACAAAATPTPVPSPATPPPSPLPAGTFTSVAFKPSVTYTVATGWANPEDGATYFLLAPVGADLVGIHLFRDAAAASQEASCPTSPEPGVGTTATDLVTWIGERPGLTVSDPKPTTTGGLHGLVIDVQIVDGWLASCPFANGIPTVPLIVGPASSLRWVVAGNERLRLYVLDVPGGGTVIVDVDAFDGDLFETFAAEAAPIVASMVFTTD